MTCCTAPAKAAAVEQFGPSLLPDQPPKEIWTWPPAALMALMVDWSVPPVSGREPSQRGTQPPPDRMNAMVKERTPVWLMIEVALGGLPQPR